MGTLSTGSSHLIATPCCGTGKFFTLTIGDGTQLSEIVLDDWESEDDFGFVGLVTGDVFSVDPSAPTIGDLLGFGNHGPPVGEDFLQDMGKGPGSIGFTGALGPGVYSFWINPGANTGASITQDLRFVVESSSPAC